MNEQLREALDRANRAYDAMTDEQKAEMWRAQRESWIRAMAPCEHGDPDWETCPKCRGWDENKSLTNGNK